MVTRHDPSKWADQQMFTTGEAAEICRVSQQTIIRCFDKGRLQGFRVPGSRFRKIPRLELLRFMKANDITTDILEPSTRRVLIVDGDGDFAGNVRDALRRDGRFEVDTAATGYDAGLMTEKLKPHVVLLDLTLPDVNGSLICQRIRSNAELPATKVLVFSTGLSDRDLEHLTMNGADGFVKKPVGTKKLLGRIEEVLDL